jgi:hypothetical protein
MPITQGEPETAFLEPVGEDPNATAVYPAPSRGPETTVLSPPPADTGSESQPPPPDAQPKPRGRRQPGRHRRGHTLADDIFELGDDEE